MAKPYIFQVQSPRGTEYLQLLYKPFSGFLCSHATPGLKHLIGPVVDPYSLKYSIVRSISRASVDYVQAFAHDGEDFYRLAKKAFRRAFKRKRHTERAVRGAGWDAYTGRHGAGAFK